MANGKSGAPKGNTNGKSYRRFQQATLRALARASEGSVSKGLDMVCDKLVAAALEGDKHAIQMVAERVEGKPVQQILADINTHTVVSVEGADALRPKLLEALARRTEPTQH